MVSAWIIFNPLSNRYTAYILILASFPFIILVNQIINLRVFYFENTGAVFSIKYYHPLKKGIIKPIVEYPNYLLRAFKIEQSFFADIMIIEILTKQKVNIKIIKIKVSNMSKKDQTKIINSFI